MPRKPRARKEPPSEPTATASPQDENPPVRNLPMEFPTEPTAPVPSTAEARPPAPEFTLEPLAEASPSPESEPTSPAPDPAAPMPPLSQLRRQQKQQLERELEEARALARKAKEMAKRVKKERKLRQEIEKHAEHVKRLAPTLGYDPQRSVCEIPPLTNPNLHELEFQTIQEGRSFVRIVFDPTTNRNLYEVIEPPLTATERNILDFIRDTLVRTLEGYRRSDGNDWYQYLTRAIDAVIVDHAILVDDVSKQRVLYYLLRDFIGYGEIDVLMRDPMIEDISCDGPGIPIYLFHRQHESIKTNVVFQDETELDRFVIRLAQRSGKHISIADPLLDATLPDGSRLQASLSKEVTTRGSSFTIRKFRADPLTPPDLIRMGTMSPSMAAYFWLSMEEGKSLIFAGGTASGKTTSLNATCLFIPPDKKIVSIEDTREINLRHENWIAGLTRSGFGGEIVGGRVAGTVDMYKLLEAALRQRPEYLLVGEVRGAEAMTLFQAMATGHATYSTLHADSVASAVYRLENPPIKVPRIMLQTLDALVVQAQVRVNGKPLRRIREVAEVVGFDPKTGDLVTNTVFRWDAATDSFDFLGKSFVFDRVRETNSLAPGELEDEWANRTEILEWMAESGIRHIGEVANIVSEYYRRPEAVLERVQAWRRANPGPRPTLVVP